MRNRQTGFTLVELLVVITIIVILLALLAPALDNPTAAYPVRDGGSATVPNRWINIPIR